LVKVKNDLNFRKSSPEESNQEAIEETLINTKNSFRENKLEIESVKPLSQSISYFEVQSINTQMEEETLKQKEIISEDKSSQVI